MKTKPNVTVYDFIDNVTDHNREIIKELLGNPKRIPTKFFFHKAGGALFDNLSQQPEYYIRRSEQRLLAAHIKKIKQQYLNKPATLIDLAASSLDTLKYLFNTNRFYEYAPIHTAKKNLIESCNTVATNYPKIKIKANVFDFCNQWEDSHLSKQLNRVAYFSNSAIGNLSPYDRTALLTKVRGCIKDFNGLMVVSADLVKEPATLVSAYSNANGRAEAFIRNGLANINEILNGDIDLELFEYKAEYDSKAQKVDMVLRCNANHVITLNNQKFTFRKGEKLFTLQSYKFTEKEFVSIVEKTGFVHLESYIDPKHQTGLFIFKVA